MTWTRVFENPLAARALVELRCESRKCRWYAESGLPLGPAFGNERAALAYARERGWRAERARTSASSPVRARALLSRSPYTAVDVIRAARDLADEGLGFFGGNPSKVYISDVLAALPGLTKRDLLAMHQQGEITLSRLDLVSAAYDHGEGDKVQKSETSPGSDQKHLVIVP